MVTLVTVTTKSKSPNIYELSVRIMAIEVPTPHRSPELRARWNWYAIVDCTCWWYCNLDQLINVQTSGHFWGVALILSIFFFLQIIFFDVLTYTTNTISILAFNVRQAVQNEKGEEGEEGEEGLSQSMPQLPRTSPALRHKHAYLYVKKSL
jgi:hypothetical protein